MSELSASDRMLRQAFKQMNPAMVWLWRLGLGPLLNSGPVDLTGSYMVLVHTGRRSGMRRFTPLNFAEISGDIYVVAGFGGKADWYRNLMANPEIEIWLPDGRFAAAAVDVSHAPDRIASLRQVLVHSGFAARVFEGIDARTITSSDLDARTAHYKIVRIRRQHFIAENVDGPGEYAWIWLVVAAVLGLGLLIRRLARRQR
jgi:deazaflavin-dependent oxidoreductase (nitroreductase family)